MSKKLQKSLQGYLSKIKKQTPHLYFSHSSLSSTAGKIFSGCKHPKSLSFRIDRKNNENLDHHNENESSAATLEDIDRFLIENFKSLYSQDNHEISSNQREEEKTRDLGGSHFSLSSSGSLLEEATTSSAGTEDVGSASASTVDHGVHIPRGFEDCITVLTVSQSPYEDFRRSMQEMVEARVHQKQRVDWEFMEELLFCYLRLNEKKQHRFILSAFADLIVILRQDSCNEGIDGENNGSSVEKIREG